MIYIGLPIFAVCIKLIFFFCVLHNDIFTEKRGCKISITCTCKIVDFLKTLYL